MFSGRLLVKHCGEPGLGTALDAGLCLILIPRWGINGEAVAAAAGVVLWNMVLW